MIRIMTDTKLKLLKEEAKNEGFCKGVDKIMEFLRSANIEKDAKRGFYHNRIFYEPVTLPNCSWISNCFFYGKGQALIKNPKKKKPTVGHPAGRGR